MRMQDLILVSVDDHIIEPPTMFDRHTPVKYKGRMPQVKRTSKGLEVWAVESENLVWGAIGLNAVAGRRPEEYGVDPTSYAEMRKGCWDVHARVDDQNANGILATLNFGTFPLFSGVRFMEYKDQDLALATVQAYNDWHIDEWCGAYPGRFIPLGHVPFWNPAATVEELRRINAKGCHAITLPPNPTRHGLPSFHNIDYWRPILAACDEMGIVLCLHIGDATGAVTSPDAPVDVFITNMPVTLYATAADLLFSPVLRTFKNIKVALTEGGAGWVPHFLERADYVYRHHSAWTHQDFGGRLPSEVFLEHVQFCFIDDKTAINARHACGIDNLTYECDYPHSDCTFPKAPEVLWESIKDLPDEEIEKICYRNANRFYSFDPFRHIPREQCTVGALRAKATHVDVGWLNTGHSFGESTRSAKTVSFETFAKASTPVTFEQYSKDNPVEISTRMSA